MINRMVALMLHVRLFVLERALSFVKLERVDLVIVVALSALLTAQDHVEKNVITAVPITVLVVEVLA